MSFRPLTWITVAVFGLAASAMACLWDNDTLAEESKGKLDLLSTIVGRFERNPPLYYEMRLKRVAAELANHPSRIALYDDAAVACDRLGRGDEAIAWIEKKRAQMPPLEKSDAAMREHWYRYYANAGTFWAHRWFRDGAKKERIKELEKGRDLIKKAIEINPNAHFGREKYQLAIMNWILTNRHVDAPEQSPSLNHFLDAHMRGKEPDGSPERKERTIGLAGLIRLGGAWESTDVFNALSHSFADERLGVLSYLAALREQELLGSGRRSALPSVDRDRPHYADGAASTPPMNSFHAREFEQMRRNADEWHENRTAFMIARLREGKHPDTHHDFWDGYREVPAREPGTPPLFARWGENGVITYVLLFLVLSAGVATLGGLIWAGRRLYAKLATARRP